MAGVGLGKREEEERAAKEAEEIRKIILPNRSRLEMFGVVTQRLGSNQIRIMCEDGTERVCRIPGKMRKRVWMRAGDIVIVRLWEFQKIKADVAWRYSGAQPEHLKKKGYLEKLPLG